MRDCKSLPALINKEQHNRKFQYTGRTKSYNALPMFAP